MSSSVREYEHNGVKQHMGVVSSAYKTQFAEPGCPLKFLCVGSVPPQNLFVGVDYIANSIISLVNSNDML